MKGLRLTRRGEAVRDAAVVILSAGLFFPVLTIIISLFHTLGVQ